MVAKYVSVYRLFDGYEYIFLSAHVSDAVGYTCCVAPLPVPRTECADNEIILIILPDMILKVVVALCFSEYNQSTSYAVSDLVTHNK